MMPPRTFTTSRCSMRAACEAGSSWRKRSQRSACTARRSSASSRRCAVPSVPTAVWGRDELHAGEMWNSNSLISWLIVSAGLDASGVQLPERGRAPGWGPEWKSRCGASARRHPHDRSEFSVADSDPSADAHGQLSVSRIGNCARVRDGYSSSVTRGHARARPARIEGSICRENVTADARPCTPVPPVKW